MHSAPAAASRSRASRTRSLVERLDDRSIRADSFAHPEPHRAWGEKDRGLGVEADLVHLLPHLAPDLEGVPEPLGGDDSEPSALSFQHRVGRHRGAVRELGEGPGLDSLRREALDGRERGLAGVRRRARHLEHDGRAPVAHAHHVRERAPHVHPDPATGPRFSHASPLSKATFRGSIGIAPVNRADFPKPVPCELRGTGGAFRAGIVRCSRLDQGVFAPKGQKMRQIRMRSVKQQLGSAAGETMNYKAAVIHERGTPRLHAGISCRWSWR